ncbi:MAG TPA: MFS transporter [Clostridia bacterium]|mgnify:CR=1 FL=1|nr:MAG: putative transporter [Firmicutes bacterium ADurb.Bin146]HOD92275.1 MFS transporter [Clostridia bacterium]HQM38726.1 MFS transporter [Clostridia bacterium]
MYSLLLVIIYVAFISLGLPDSLLGSAWPVIYKQMDIPISYAGIITMIIASGTIISSLLSDKLTKKIGVGYVTAISVMMTALALFGFSISNSFIVLCILAVPYGLGAGGVDAALNNYVALHYKSSHMSWLHCFWGVGAAVSPYIMGYSLTGGLGWNSGYRIVSVIQICLTVILFISLPIWKKNNISKTSVPFESADLSISQAVKIKGVKYMLFTFFCYCALESTAGLWASSYLVEFRGIDKETAAQFASLFYIGITFGRFISGFVSERIGDRRLIRSGILVISAGIIMVGIPLGNNILALIGLIIIGLGCAPVYPSIIHSTPYNFGKENSQSIIGIQMASAYVGSTFMPPLFGLIAQHINIGLYPLFLCIFAITMLVMSELLQRKLVRNPN